MRTLLFLLLAGGISLLLLVYPLLPGSYDPAGSSLSMAFQLFSVLGLLTLIPAAAWLYRALRLRRAAAEDAPALRAMRRHARAYLWTFAAVWIPIVLVLTLSVSRITGLLLGLGLILGIWQALRRISQVRTLAGFPPVLPALLALWPAALLGVHLLLSTPLTAWSRARAIAHSRELAAQLESFHTQHGSYPLTINGLHQDYQTGVCGIEAFRYTYDGSTYHLYFEQPKLFLDQPGTREMVVYSPAGEPFMMSHVSWHMLIEPELIRSRQGWYAANETGMPGWRYLWFD